MLPMLGQMIADAYNTATGFILEHTATELTLVAIFVISMVTWQQLSTARYDNNTTFAADDNKYNTTPVALMIKLHETKNKGH